MKARSVTDVPQATLEEMFPEALRQYLRLVFSRKPRIAPAPEKAIRARAPAKHADLF
jgi:hypothetical protein